MPFPSHLPPFGRIEFFRTEGGDCPPPGSGCGGVAGPTGWDKPCPGQAGADADSVYGFMCAPGAPLALPRRRLGHTIYQGPSPCEPVLQYLSLRIIEGCEYYPVW
jgi:hypothetical protein